MIVVIGSSNTDMVVKTNHLPLPGETVLGGSFFMNAGGKGANQAVAAARLYGDVTFIAKVGNDLFGKNAVELFKAENINTNFIYTDHQHASGVALITVDKDGENCIAVASGANEALHVEEINAAAHIIAKADIILMQLEIPLAVIEHVAHFAHQHQKKLILNPAPATSLSDELLSQVSIITPNEKEASMLTGIDIIDTTSAKEAALLLAAKGINTIIITLGAAGALVYHEKEFTIVESNIVKAIDTTAAGDVFNGALSVALSEDKTMLEAVKFANEAAAISVTRLGAQASAPHRKELSS